MAENWAVDVKKYVPDADETIIAGIVRYCGIALQKRDSSLVSFSDPKELARVRTNFLKKKLGLDLADDALDAAIAKVGEQMKADRTKNRVTVYYLLAESFGKLSVFEKKVAAKSSTGAKKAAPAKASAKPAGKAAAADAPAAVASLSSITKGVNKPVDESEAATTPPAASPAISAAEGATPTSTEATAPAPATSEVVQKVAEEQSAATFPSWLLWMIGLIVIAWLIWFLFMRTAS